MRFGCKFDVSRSCASGVDCMPCSGWNGSSCAIESVCLYKFLVGKSRVRRYAEVVQFARFTTMLVSCRIDHLTDWAPALGGRIDRGYRHIFPIAWFVPRMRKASSARTQRSTPGVGWPCSAVAFRNVAVSLRPLFRRIFSVATVDRGWASRKARTNMCVGGDPGMGRS